MKPVNVDSGDITLYVQSITVDCGGVTLSVEPVSVVASHRLDNLLE